MNEEIAEFCIGKRADGQFVATIPVTVDEALLGYGFHGFGFLGLLFPLLFLFLGLTATSFWIEARLSDRAFSASAPVASASARAIAACTSSGMVEAERTV